MIDENEAFWNQTLAESRQTIEQALHPPNYKRLPGALGWCMRHLHVTPVTDPNAFMAGTIYSRSLNYLGVQVQRSGDLEKAAACFSDALALNTNNIVAAVNLDFNKTLRAGLPTPVSATKITADQFGRYRNWTEVLAANGPFDESSFCFENGAFFMQASPPLTHQAGAQFDRVPPTGAGQPAHPLFPGADLSGVPPAGCGFGRFERSAECSFRFALSGYTRVPPHWTYWRQAPTWPRATAPLPPPCWKRKWAGIRTTKPCCSWPPKLFNTGRPLHQRAPCHRPQTGPHARMIPIWIFGKGIVCFQVGAYDDAVTAFSRFLEIETNHPDALLGRAVGSISKRPSGCRARGFSPSSQASHTNNYRSRLRPGRNCLAPAPDQ